MLLRRICLFTIGLALLSLDRSSAAQSSFGETNPLELPAIGSHHLRLLSPTLLELTLITTKDPDPARAKQWDFVGDNFKPQLPTLQEFTVLVNGRPGTVVQKIGFKRRALYGPLKRRDLRIGNYLYLELTRPISDGQTVEVKNHTGRLWSKEVVFKTAADPMRWNPAIHVNQTGYLPEFEKKAMVGYYLGSLGEMILPRGTDGTERFTLIEAASGKEVYAGQLKMRPDVGFTFPTYQQVLEADFSAFKTPGEYRLLVPGLGASFPFLIDDGIAACFARTYALGLYHQRCGAKNEYPFTRFIHGACHMAAAEVPTKKFESTQAFIKDMSNDYKNNPRHAARQLKDVDSSLYPFVNQGNVDVSGGHHDAGDYSKYTINSAALIHYLVFAADALPGVGGLDNLGLPESGDAKSDLLQEAKWEADFLAKLQDGDGGFYFLVYPRDRKYEDNVLPDQGDPQVVWPKTTAVTAAAVAALAQTASSPLFQKQFPADAKVYLEKARLGWSFLERAIARHGQQASYQKISHYGDEFIHDDELAWAAVEMFLATGEAAFEKKLISQFDPTNRETKRWTWWRLYEAYGCAIRSYAFGAKTGRIRADRLNPEFLSKCRTEILAAGQDQLRFAQESAYGTSFPDPTKRFRTAGWYFSSDRAFDLAVASQLDSPPGTAPRPDFIGAIISNMNYEGGCNPVNVTYLTGLGWKRQRDVVHQYAQNDDRLLPPSGIPIGNVQAGFQFLHHYGKELGALSFPPDGAEDRPYPFYDRWGDSFNVSAEFVAANQARSLASLAFLMAQTPLKQQPWKAASAQIAGVPTEVQAGQPVVVQLKAPGMDLQKARIVWETLDQEPAFGQSFTFKPKGAGNHWIEAEAQWPDGRRVFALTNMVVRDVSGKAGPAKTRP
jgi:hypothetical protein